MDSIEFINCSKNFLNHWLFKDFSNKFEINPGNSYAFLGKNGSGKSTLTLLLVGQTSPTQGQIIWSENGKQIDVDQLKMKDLFKRDMQGIIEWWRPKAVDRYKKLKSESNLKTNIHFYNQMIGMSYEEAKSVYFHEVGR